MDARISNSSIKTFGQCDSSLLKKSALLFFLIVPSITVERERLLVVLPPVRSQGLSAGRGHDVWRLPEAATTIPGTAVSSISFRSFHLGELSSYPQTSPPCISLEVPKKCFAGVFPNRSLTTSLKITLLLSGMHFVKLSTYVDAF